MKFIVDAQLPRRLALRLREAGYDAVHTLDLPHGNRITDSEINRLSELETRVVVTKDADFVNSFIVARRPVGRMPVRAIRRMEFIATTRSAERPRGASALPFRLTRVTFPPYAR